jgi:small conductance mechanosensitive channel
MQDLNPWTIDDTISGILNWLSTVGLEKLINIGLALIFGVASYFLIWFIVKNILNRLTSSQSKHKAESKDELLKRRDTLYDIFRNALKVVVAISVIIKILIEFGVDVAPLFASAGIIGVALGFGAQNIVKDCLAGVFIILENQFRVGDFIEVDASGMLRAKGNVEKLSLRSTMIRDREGDVHFINNGLMIQVINRTLGYSKGLFIFRIFTTTDIELVKKLIDETGEAMNSDEAWKKKIHEPMHFKELGEINGDTIEVITVGTTKPGEQWNVSDEFKQRLVKSLHKHKIELPPALAIG